MKTSCSLVPYSWLPLLSIAFLHSKAYQFSTARYHFRCVYAFQKYPLSFLLSARVHCRASSALSRHSFILMSSLLYWGWIFHILQFRISKVMRVGYFVVSQQSPSCPAYSLLYTFFIVLSVYPQTSISRYTHVLHLLDRLRILRALFVPVWCNWSEWCADDAHIQI